MAEPQPNQTKRVSRKDAKAAKKSCKKDDSLASFLSGLCADLCAFARNSSFPVFVLSLTGREALKHNLPLK